MTSPVLVAVVVASAILILGLFVMRNRRPDNIDSFRRQIDALSPEARRPVVDQVNRLDLDLDLNPTPITNRDGGGVDAGDDGDGVSDIDADAADTDANADSDATAGPDDGDDHEQGGDGHGT